MESKSRPGSLALGYQVKKRAYNKPYKVVTNETEISSTMNEDESNEPSPTRLPNRPEEAKLSYGRVPIQA